MKERTFKKGVKGFALSLQGLGSQLLGADLDGAGMDGDKMAEILARLGVAEDLVSAACWEIREGAK